MRTNIVIDDELIAKAMALSGHRTKKGVVEAALRLFVQLKGQEKLKDLRGKIHWEGDLDAMRQDRHRNRD